MIQYYLKLAARNIRTAKFYSFVSIIGLATGMACCILVFLFIKDEYSYDQQTRNAGQVYRINMHLVNDDGSLISSPHATGAGGSYPPTNPGSIHCYKVISTVFRVGKQVLCQEWGEEIYRSEHYGHPISLTAIHQHFR